MENQNSATGLAVSSTSNFWPSKIFIIIFGLYLVFFGYVFINAYKCETGSNSNYYRHEAGFNYDSCVEPVYFLGLPSSAFIIAPIVNMHNSVQGYLNYTFLYLIPVFVNIVFFYLLGVLKANHTKRLILLLFIFISLSIYELWNVIVHTPM